MNRHEDILPNRCTPTSSPHLMKANDLTKHGLGCRDAKTDDDARCYCLHFRFKPRPTGGDFGGRRFFVLASPALWLPFEMFHGIRDIDVLSRDPGFRQCLI